MHLTAEKFASIVGWGTASPGFGRTGERRRAPRMSRQCKATAVMDLGRGSITTTLVIKDLSARGIGFIYPSALEPGAQFVLRLDRNSGQPVEVVYTVVKCQPLNDDLFKVGAELTCMLGNQAPQYVTGGMTVPVQSEQDIRHAILGH